MSRNPCYNRKCIDCKLHTGFKDTYNTYLCRKKLRESTIKICEICLSQITCETPCIKIDLLYKRE